MESLGALGGVRALSMIGLGTPKVGKGRSPGEWRGSRSLDLRKL